MAEGLSRITNCDIAICTTGIAGPTGGTPNKPVGLVYISVKYNNIITIKEIRLNPNLDRITMKNEFTNHALKLAIDVLTQDRI